MSAAVSIVDYDVGNLLSVWRAVERCGAVPNLVTEAEGILGADRLILPGVGAFGDCVAALRERRLVEPLLAFAASGKPMLGICVGMQMMLESSGEFGRHAGLGIIPGTVEAIPRTNAAGARHKVPHIGWSDLEPPRGANDDRWAGSVLADVPPGSPAYFVHSYTAVPADPGHRLADAYYNGCLVAAAVRRDNVTGTQFHPEKSGHVGLRIISAFLAA
jgi:glutamine amidotransferase